MFIKDNYA